jgi:hypothetical protein
MFALATTIILWACGKAWAALRGVGACLLVLHHSLLGSCVFLSMGLPTHVPFGAMQYAQRVHALGETLAKLSNSDWRLWAA